MLDNKSRYLPQLVFTVNKNNLHVYVNIYNSYTYTYTHTQVLNHIFQVKMLYSRIPQGMNLSSGSQF